MVSERQNVYEKTCGPYISYDTIHIINASLYFEFLDAFSRAHQMPFESREWYFISLGVFEHET
jgi:hypothetical protein